MRTLHALFSRLLVSLVLLFLLAGLDPAASRAQAPPKGDQTFPSQPFLGMQATYAVAGADLEAPSDTAGYAILRKYKGVFAGETLTFTGSSSELTGSCNVSTGDSFIMLNAAIWVDGVRKDFASKNPCEGAKSMAPNQAVNLGKTDFSLSLPVPPGATEGGFFVRMTSIRDGAKIEVLEISGVIGAKGKPLPAAEDMILAQATPIPRLPGDESPADTRRAPAAAAVPPAKASDTATVSTGSPAAGGGASGGGGSFTEPESSFSPVLLIVFLVLCVALLGAIAVVVRRRRLAEPALSPESHLNVAASLKIHDSSGRSRVFALKKGIVRIGRDASNDVILQDPEVSSFHAVIEISRGRFLLKDAGSANGTFLNGERVAESVLYLEDEISIGAARLILRS